MATLYTADNFKTSTGNLSGQVAYVGGTWATLQTANGFTVGTLGGCYPAQNADSYAVINTVVPAGSVTQDAGFEILFHTDIGQGYIGGCFLVIDVNNFFQVRYNMTSHKYEMYQCVAGVFTQVGTAGGIAHGFPGANVREVISARVAETSPGAPGLAGVAMYLNGSLIDGPSSCAIADTSLAGKLGVVGNTGGSVYSHVAGAEITAVYSSSNDQVFFIDPRSAPGNSTGNILELTGVNTNWVAQTFSGSGVTGFAVLGTTVFNSVKSVTLNDVRGSTGGNAGTVQVTDGTNSSPFLVTGALFNSYVGDAHVNYDKDAQRLVGSGSTAVLQTNSSGNRICAAIISSGSGRLDIVMDNSAANTNQAMEWWISTDGAAETGPYAVDNSSPDTDLVVPCLTGLSAATHLHEAILRYTAIDQTWVPQGSFTVPTGEAVFKYFQSDAGSSAGTLSGFIAPKAKKILAYSNSIVVHGSNTTRPHRSIIHGLRKALNADISGIGMPGQSWNGADTAGHVPKFITAYNKHFSGVNRTLVNTYDACFVFMGTNEGGADVTAVVSQWLLDARTYLGAACEIWIFLPFSPGGTYTNSNASIAAAVNASTDTKVHLADIYTGNFQYLGGTAAFTASEPHNTDTGSVWLTAAIAAQVGIGLDGGGGGGGSSNTVIGSMHIGI